MTCFGFEMLASNTVMNAKSQERYPCFSGHAGIWQPYSRLIACLFNVQQKRLKTLRPPKGSQRLDNGKTAVHVHEYYFPYDAPWKKKKSLETPLVRRRMTYDMISWEEVFLFPTSLHGAALSSQREESITLCPNKSKQLIGYCPTASRRAVCRSFSRREV